MRKILLLIIGLMPVFSFSQSLQGVENSYSNEIEHWQKNRVKSLKSETGWLNIVGLFWLQEGENTFGSGKENKIVFPKGKADKKLGSFILKDGVIILKIAVNTTINADNKPFTAGVIFDGKEE